MPYIRKLNLTNFLFQPSPSFPRELLEPYNKALVYLKSSHKSPDILDSEDVIHITKQDDESVGMKNLLEEEIEKYNKLKLQKQVDCISGLGE